MELQEVLLRGLSVQIRFPARPLFWDVRGRMAEELVSVHQAEEWQLGGQELRLARKDRAAAFVVGSHELRSHHEIVEDRAATLKTTTGFLEYAIEVLKVETVDFIGVRTYWAGAVDSFESARGWMLERFGGGAAELVASLRQPISDVGWIFEMHERDPRLTLRLGPMSQDHLVAYEAFSEEVRDTLPLSSVFFDLDRVLRDEPTSGSDAVRKVVASFEKNVELGEALAATLAS